MRLPPIAVVAYNRPQSVARVLASLLRAKLPDGVPLHLFIDNGGPNGTAELCRSFDWPKGQKHLHVATQQLGMRENSLRAGDLALTEGSVIFLEDDSAVSPYFYHFATEALKAYQHDPLVNAVSLYNFEFCEFDQLRFHPIIDGYDNYFLGSATTWATMFLQGGWSRFREWLGKHGRSSISLSDGVPQSVTEWPATSWKRYLNKYLAQTSELFCYPRFAYATNFADAGAHFAGGNANFRVPLAHGYIGSRLSSPRDSLARYDAFFEVHSDVIYEHLGLQDPELLDIDLRGLKALPQLDAPFTLSIRGQARPTKRFGISSFPMEANILEGADGDVIAFGPRATLQEQKVLSSSALCRYYHHDLGGHREVGLLLRRLSSILPGR